MLSFVENKESTRCSQWIFLICLFWLLLALLLFTASNPALHHRPFGMEHAWVSAHFAVIARTFAEYGVFGLHGIPIQNNGLLSGRPDVYLHWPPLFGILLSQLNLLFGASENTAYGMMFTIMLMNALLLFLIARRLSSTEAGLLSAFAWFALPINIKFGYLVLHLNFAITMVLLAILFLVRRIQNVGLHAVNTAFGCCAIAIATLTSWEPVLMTSGLWLAVWLANVPQLRMTLAAYMITAIAIASGVLAWYSFMYPEMASDIIHAVLRRLNLAREAPSIDDIY
ncbi:ArnT family glycosyltransferase, partial [Methylomagnum sp.]